jgi:CheY-like chemotaxis protein
MKPLSAALVACETICAVVVSVLIVDDHASFRRLARRLLERAGYRVVGEAHDGGSALAAVDELDPDVVLLDVLLPDTSGFAVADRLAERGRRPVVVLTSSRGASDYGAAVAGRRFVPKGELTPARIAAAVGGSP